MVVSEEPSRHREPSSDVEDIYTGPKFWERNVNSGPGKPDCPPESVRLSSRLKDEPRTPAGRGYRNSTEGFMGLNSYV